MHIRNLGVTTYKEVGLVKKKKKKQKHCYQGSDWHHILFQRRHWQQGYAKALREHPYMGKYIPQATLHRTIHSKIHDIPTPNGKECRKAYLELCRREREGLIDIKYDTLEQRIDFLLEVWSNDNCEATLAMLRWQKQVVQKFYRKEE